MAAPYNNVDFTGKTYDAKASLMDYSARWYNFWRSAKLNAKKMKGMG
jgi:hypothetical protein